MQPSCHQHAEDGPDSSILESEGSQPSQAMLTCWIFWFGLNVCWLAILLSVWYPSSTVPITTCTATDASHGSPSSAGSATTSCQRRKACAGSCMTQESTRLGLGAHSAHQAMAQDQDLQDSRRQHDLQEHAGSAGQAEWLCKIEIMCATQSDDHILLEC